MPLLIPTHSVLLHYVGSYSDKEMCSLHCHILYLAAKLCRVAVNTVKIIIARVHSTQPAKYTPSCELIYSAVEKLLWMKRNKSGSCEWVAVYWICPGSLLSSGFSRLSAQEAMNVLIVAHLITNTSSVSIWLEFETWNLAQGFAVNGIFRAWKHVTSLYKGILIFDSTRAILNNKLNQYHRAESHGKLQSPSFIHSRLYSHLLTSLSISPLPSFQISQKTLPANVWSPPCVLRRPSQGRGSVKFLNVAVIPSTAKDF